MRCPGGPARRGLDLTARQIAFDEKGFDAFDLHQAAFNMARWRSITAAPNAAPIPLMEFCMIACPALRAL
jgi:hypothetical protein